MSFPPNPHSQPQRVSNGFCESTRIHLHSGSCPSPGLSFRRPGDPGDSSQSHGPPASAPRDGENGASRQDPQSLVVSTSFQVTMFLRLPPFLLPFIFFLCTPSPIAGPRHPELVAERADPGAEQGIQGPREVPWYSWGTAFSSALLRGKLRQREARKGTWPQTLQAQRFPLDWDMARPGAGIRKRFSILETSRMHDRQEDRRLPCQPGWDRTLPRRTEPALPRWPLPTAQPAHTCLGPGLAKQGGVGLPERPHQRHPGYPRFLTRPPEPCSAPPQSRRHSLPSPQAWASLPQCGSKGTSSMKPP